MIIAKIIIFSLIMLGISYLEGSLVSSLLEDGKRYKDSFLLRIVLGYVSLMLLASCGFFIAGKIKCKSVYALLITVFLALIFTISLIVCARKKNKKIILMPAISIVKDRKIAGLGILNLLLIVVQIVCVTIFRYENINAVRQVSIATYVYDKGVVSDSSWIMSLWGAISSLLRVHPLSFIYTILPLLVISVSYLLYYELSKAVLRDNLRGALISLLVVSGLNIWGYQSEMLIPVTLLMSWFMGTSFLVHLLLPTILIVIVYKWDGLIENNVVASDVEEIEEIDEEYQEEWDMKKHKIINARNLAICWALLAVTLVAVVFVLNRKINNLHAATANLQMDLSDRCSIYEFVSPSGSVDGYLIKGSDGKLTMFGGGSKDNTEALYSFLAEYGYELENWYLPDAEEENVGAYLGCTSDKGISVANTYLLNRTEIKK